MKITKYDLDENNYYAASDSLESDESIEIDGDLGTVMFRGYLKTKLSIIAKAGSGIKAGEGIEAGLGIKAGEEISATLRIFAGICRSCIPNPEEMTIAAKRVKGVVAHGNVVLVPSSDAPKNTSEEAQG